jgi:hypothetical protein
VHQVKIDKELTTFITAYIYQSGELQNTFTNTLIQKNRTRRSVVKKVRCMTSMVAIPGEFEVYSVRHSSLFIENGMQADSACYFGDYKRNSTECHASVPLQTFCTLFRQNETQ